MSALEEVCTYGRGYTLYRQPNEVGGWTYISNAIGGGVVVWDTCLVSAEELNIAMRAERMRALADGGA